MDTSRVAAGSAAVGSLLAQRCPGTVPRGNVWTANVRMERERGRYADNDIENARIQKALSYSNRMATFISS